MAPGTRERASLEEDSRSYPRSILDGIALNVEYQTGLHSAAPGIKPVYGFALFERAVAAAAGAGWKLFQEVNGTRPMPMMAS